MYDNSNNMVDFGNWLLAEMEKQNLTQAELARRAKVSQSTISLVISGKRGVGETFCNSIATGLGLPAETVFRMARLLPNRPGTDEDFEELKHLFNQMTDAEQREFLAMGRLKIDLRNQRGDAHDPTSARTARARP